LFFPTFFGFFGGLFLMTFIFRTFAASTPATVGSIFGRLTDRLGRLHVLQPRHDDVLTTLSRRR
jgi:hypothetical protein